MKRLLTMFIVALAVVAQANAAPADGYVYTSGGRYKVLSDNLIANGDFSSGLDGWVTESGEPVSQDMFTVVAGGPDGKNCIVVSSSAGADPTGSLFVKVPAEAGSDYVISYNIKAASTLSSTSIKEGSKNYQNVYFNQDGSAGTSSAGYDAIATAQTYDTGWKTITYDYEAAQDGYILVDLGNLRQGDSYADFSIYRCNEVGDDRLIERAISRLEWFLADENKELFPNSRETLEMPIQDLKSLLGTEMGVEEVNDVLSYIVGPDNTPLQEFLDANSANVTPFLKCPNFDDATIASKVSNIGGGWTATGGRWFVRPESFPFTSTFIEASIPGHMKLAESKVYQTIDLPAGTYMFTTKGRAQVYADERDGYRIDQGKEFGGIKIFLNGDSADCYPVSTTSLNTYTVLTEIKEGETLTIGYYLPGNVGNAAQFDDTELRLIGGSVSDVEDYVNSKAIASARSALKVSIDSADVLLASDRYLYAKKELGDSLALARDAYDNATKASVVEDRTQKLNKTISAFHTINAEYVTLGDDIAGCKELMADDSRPNGKDALGAAISTAEAFYGSLTAENRDSVGMVSADAALIAARTVFYDANASYATPALQGLVNGDFSSGTTGWDLEDDKSWKVRSSSLFSTGRALAYDRGSSAHDPRHAWQDVAVAGAGMYEFTCEIYAYNSSSSLDGPETGVYVICGDNRVQVHTDATPDRITVRTVTDGPTTLRVGLDALQNKLCNKIYFGACTLTYYGDYDKYVADSIKAAMDPVRDSLEAAIGEAQDMLSSSRNPNGVDTKPFANAISDARSVCDGSTDINALWGAIDALAAARNTFMTSGVWPAEGKYFDLTALIANADFADGTEGWTCSGDRLAADNGGVSLYYGAGTLRSSRMAQVLQGLPAGVYQAETGATYRLNLPDNDWNFADYEAMEPMFLVANEDSVPVRGLLSNADRDYVENVLKLSFDDYRHGTNIFPLIEAGHYTTTLDFSLEQAGPLEIGISVCNIPSASYSFVAGVQLRYYGDKVADGIEAIEGDSATPAVGDVYSITGQKVRSGATSLEGLPRGIYIFNGKKYVVR